MNHPINSQFNIENKTISNDSPTYFIADVGANHDGDLERAKDLIYKAAEAGADAAKFQHFAANTIVSGFGFKNLGSQQSHQKKWKKSVCDVYEDASINQDWTPILKETCQKAGIHFFTSPYSTELVDHIDPFVSAYKVGSGDITWIKIIKYMASKNKPMIIASGASTFDDVIRAVNAIISINPNICLMQCNTNYTGSLENMKHIKLNVLKSYRDMFPTMPLGLSDHTPGYVTVLGAVALGACMVEKHFTDDCKRVGPDHNFSMVPASWREMVNRTRELEHALGDGIKKVEDNEKETVILQRRSIRFADNLKAGHVLTENDLESLRPCPKDALEPYLLESIIGKSINVDITKGDHVRWQLLK